MSDQGALLRSFSSHESQTALMTMDYTPPLRSVHAVVDVHNGSPLPLAFMVPPMTHRVQLTGNHAVDALALLQYTRACSDGDTLEVDTAGTDPRELVNALIPGALPRFMCQRIEVRGERSDNTRGVHDLACALVLACAIPTSVDLVVWFKSKMTPQLHIMLGQRVNSAMLYMQEHEYWYSPMPMPV